MFAGGSGHIFDMIRRLKANDALRKKRGNFFTRPQIKVKGKSESKPTPTQSPVYTFETYKKKPGKIITRWILTLIISLGILWFLTVLGVKLLEGFEKYPGAF